MKMKDKVIFVDRDEKRGITDNSLVSIVTPVLNGSKYLEACIQSVLDQNYPYIEHIFADGGSIDGTLDILTSYGAKYPNQVRFISEPDKGADDAANKGLQIAKGGIISFLGSDDMLEPDAIQTVVEFFRSNPDAYFVFGDCNIINETGEVIGKCKTKDFDLKEALNDKSYIPTPSAFFRREVVEKVGLFDISLPYGDFDYWIRVGRVFQIYRINSVLSNFRVHKDSLGSLKNSGKVCLRTHYIVNRRYGGSIFSLCVRRYYESVVIEFLRPVLGFTYPFIKNVLRMLRREE